MSFLFDEFFADLLVKEGGYVNNPNDSGGETMYGITKEVAKKYGYDGPMQAMPKSFAKNIYKEKYWDSLLLSDIETFSPSVAIKLADIGVNMGVSRAGEFLQRLLNVFNNDQKFYKDIVVDGSIGPKTVDTLRQFMRVRSRDGELVMVRALNCLQGAFYINLAETRKKDETFVYGWILNRIA